MPTLVIPSFCEGFSENCLPYNGISLYKLNSLRQSGAYMCQQTHLFNNGLSPGWHQAIIWANAGIFLIWALGMNFSEILIEIHMSSFQKMPLKMSAKCETLPNFVQV